MNNTTKESAPRAEFQARDVGYSCRTSSPTPRCSVPLEGESDDHRKRLSHLTQHAVLKEKSRPLGKIRRHAQFDIVARHSLEDGTARSEVNPLQGINVNSSIFKDEMSSSKTRIDESRHSLAQNNHVAGLDSVQYLTIQISATSSTMSGRECWYSKWETLSKFSRNPSMYKPHGVTRFCLFSQISDRCLPRQHVKHDASTSGVAETSGIRCSAGLSRDPKPRQGRK